MKERKKKKRKKKTPPGDTKNHDRDIYRWVPRLRTIYIC